MVTRLSCIEFGRELIQTNDLDPVYVILWNANLTPKKLERWLLAYWCFYHMGTASWIAHSGKGYWNRFQKAAGSKEYPRCSERRHYRGQQAINSTTYLQSRGVPSLFEPLRTGGTCGEVMKEVQNWVGFGPWISFKVADMLERLDLAPISFSTEDVYLFESPKIGAEKLRESLELSENDPELNGRVESWAVEYILGKIGDLEAPPQFEREIGPQEAETVLCKWKSYLNGRYTIGEDIESCHKCLNKFSSCGTSTELLKAGERAKLW